VLGALLGLTIGVPVDQALQTHPHAFGGLGGLLYGTPTGALVGLCVGAVLVGRLTPERRMRLGGFALLAAVALAGLGTLAVQTDVVRW
jgi:hypothetical protein